MITVTLLGTAALAPLPDRALSAAALRCGGRVILFDCGEGTQTAARRQGVNLMRLDLIALTHYHGDHIFGLPGLLQTLCSQERTAPLAITGPAGLEEALAPILRLAGHLPYALRLLTLPEEGLPLAALAEGWPEEARLAAFPTAHRVPSQGYRFTLARSGRFLPERARALGVPVTDWGRLQRGESVALGGALIRPAQVLGAPRRGLSVVFSGDTAPCEALTRAAAGADLLLCDATYAEDGQAALAREYGHMTFAQAAETAAKAGVKALWLTHYSQRIEEPEAFLPSAAARFPNTVCGYDGLSATLRFAQEEST